MTERPDLIDKQEITSLSTPRKRLTSAALGNITDNNNNNNNNNGNNAAGGAAAAATPTAPAP